MAILGTSNDTGKALGTLQTGYSTASSDLSPYTTYANEDFDTGRNKLYKEGNDLEQFGNLADPYYSFAEINPTQSYENLMKSYRMSPSQMAQVRNSMGFMNNKAASDGMSDSGDDLAMHAMVANSLMGQDKQDYLHNVSKIYGVDSGILNDFSRQWASLSRDFGKIMNMEYGSERDLSNIASHLASEGSRDYMEANREKNKGVGGIQTLLGDSLGVFKDMNLEKMAKDGAMIALM